MKVPEHVRFRTQPCGAQAETNHRRIGWLLCFIVALCATLATAFGFPLVQVGVSFFEVQNQSGVGQNHICQHVETFRLQQVKEWRRNLSIDRDESTPLPLPLKRCVPSLSFSFPSSPYLPSIIPTAPLLSSCPTSLWLLLHAAVCRLLRARVYLKSLPSASVLAVLGWYPRKHSEQTPSTLTPVANPLNPAVAVVSAGRK